MALYFLDTDSLTLLQRKHPRLLANLAVHIGDQIAVTSVNVDETLGGWYALLRQAKSNADRAKAAVRLANAVTNLAQFSIFPTTESSLDRFDRLVKLRLNVGGMDLKLAALALELAATVVSNNLRDFRRVPGLKVEDWTV
jgi:tRNA(fMet)-specific endonuclease VapC